MLRCRAKKKGESYSRVTEMKVGLYPAGNHEAKNRLEKESRNCSPKCSMLALDLRSSELLGTWVRQLDQNSSVSIHTWPSELQFIVTEGETSFIVHSDYGITADGTLYAVVTSVENKGMENAAQITKGDVISSQCQAKDGKLTVSDVRSTNKGESIQQLVEGQYNKRDRRE